MYRYLFLMMLAALMVAFAVAADPATRPADTQDDSTQWNTMKSPRGEVVVFGDNVESGFYGIPEGGLTLGDVLTKARLADRSKRTVLTLRRSVDPLNCKFIGVPTDSLGEAANLALQPNDIIHVITAKPPK